MPDWDSVKGRALSTYPVSLTLEDDNSRFLAFIEDILPDKVPSDDPRLGILSSRSLLAQIIPLIDRVLVDQATYHDLGIAAFNLGIELAQALELEALLDRDVGAGLDEVTWREASASLAAERIEHEGASKLESAYNEVLNELLSEETQEDISRISGDAARNARLPWSSKSDMGRQIDEVYEYPIYEHDEKKKVRFESARLDLQALRLSRELTRHNMKLQMSNTKANKTDVKTRKDASASRIDSLEAREKYEEYAKSASKPERRRILRDTLRKRIDQFTRTDGFLDLNGRRAVVRQRFEQDFSAAWTRISALSRICTASIY